MIYMFNELSITQVYSIDEVKKILEEFVKSSISAKKYGLTELRFNEQSIIDLYQINLHNEYTVEKWLNDKNIDSDLQLRFREIVANSPLIKDDDYDEKEKYQWSIFNISLDNKIHPVYGLGAAYIHGTLAISLLTHEEWTKTSIEINHNSLNFNGEELNSNRNVLHFCNEETLLVHKDWLNNQKEESTKNSIEIWSSKAEKYDNLLFGTDIESQLFLIGLSKKYFQILDCLEKLNEFAKKRKPGEFSLAAFKESTLLNVSGESASTMQKYPVLRKFKLSNGQKVQFELHIKIPDVRIYFLPDETTNKITVGYIGKHLKTSTFN